VPTRIVAEKARARIGASHNQSLLTFLAIVNGELMVSTDLRTALCSIARSLSAASASGTLDLRNRTLKRACRWLARRRDRALRVGASATANDVLTLEQFLLVRWFFLSEWAGWRCLASCVTCERYFIADDDRQIVCRPECRTSRRPEAVAQRVERHRVSTRKW